MVRADWTLNDAIKAHEEALNAGGKEPDPTLPLYQWCAVKELEICETAFKKGDKFALMLAIRQCANHDLPLPEWAARAYIAAYDTIVNARAKSWDDVFGISYPKGVHLHAIRKKRMTKFAVSNRIHEIKRTEPDTPIDEALFKRVGCEFNIGKTLAAKYYYEVKRM